VLWRTFSPQQDVSVPDGFVDIDSVVADFESDDVGRDAMIEARRFVGQAFYADRPESLAAFRLAKGWSQKRLADELSTSQPYIARLEAGDGDPQISTVRRLCSVLGISVAQFDRAFQNSR
jgi:DNA-binding XRE family transcriptional regulator